VSGASTTTVTGTGTTTYSNSNFDGWNIVITAGASSSPSLSPFGLELTVLATCNGGTMCSANPLDIYYSDTNFNVAVPAGGFQTTYSATLSGNGTTSETAAVGSSNALFSMGSTIGTVGPFSPVGGFGTATGGPATSGTYSLTLEDTFNAASGIATSFSSDANLTATPEPGTLALLGSGLLGLLMFTRRTVLN
jgi:hypothetical protein